jgi:predicted dehydrogenase
MNRISLALIGCGDVAQRDYLPELDRITDRAAIVAVCGRTEVRARETAERYGAASYTDVERMLRESRADAVVNLTPVQIHGETTLMALEAGKHVYSEKPLAGSVAEATRLVETARRRGLVLVAAPCVLLFPQVLLAGELLEEGTIGAVHTIRGRGFGGVPPWRGYGSDPTPFFAAGGGPLVDMGVYPLHAITGLIGPAQRVAAMSARAQEGFVVVDGPAAGRHVPIEVADVWHLLLELPGQAIASIEANNVARGTRARELELMGLQGTIALDLIDVSPPVDLLQDGVWRSLEVPRTGRVRGPDHLLGVEHLIDCIGSDKPPILSGEHAVHVVEILERAERSAATGTAEPLTTSFQRRR